MEFFFFTYSLISALFAEYFPTTESHWIIESTQNTKLNKHNIIFKCSLGKTSIQLQHTKRLNWLPLVCVGLFLSLLDGITSWIISLSHSQQQYWFHTSQCSWKLFEYTSCQLSQTWCLQQWVSVRISFCSVSCWVYLLLLNYVSFIFSLQWKKGLAKVQEGRKKEGGQEGAREEWLILAHWLRLIMEKAGSLASDHLANVTVEQREINGDVRV